MRVRGHVVATNPPGFPASISKHRRDRSPFPLVDVNDVVVRVQLTHPSFAALPGPTSKVRQYEPIGIVIWG